jgi:hypothetical protein
MKFELSNKQREYLGLDPVPTTWDNATLKGDTYRPDSIIYFDGDTLKRHIVSTDNEYKETQYNELTRDRKILLPKTEKGKEKKLTASVLETKTPIGVYFAADKSGSIFIGSHTTQTTFYSSNWSRKKKGEQVEVGIEKSIETFISESPKSHFDEIKDFKNAKRKNVKYRAGDVFAFKISRTEYGFGRILLDINLLRKKKLVPENHGLFNIMGPPLLVTIYAFTSTAKNIERLEAVSGHKIEDLNEFTIFPAKHFVTPEDRLKLAVDDIRAELADRLKELKNAGKILEAARLEQRTNFDLEMLTNTGFVSGIENYSRVIEGRPAGSPPSTLIDYFPDDFLLFIDESHQTIPQIGAMYEGDRSRKTTLIDYGFRLPSALDNRPLKFDEFIEKIDQTIFVSATPSAFEIEKSLSQGLKIKDKRLSTPTVVEQLIRPTGLLDPTIEIKPIKNQVDDLIERIKATTKKGQRALVATLTKRMAEELTEYL